MNCLVFLLESILLILYQLPIMFLFYLRKKVQKTHKIAELGSMAGNTFNIMYCNLLVIIRFLYWGKREFILKNCAQIRSHCMYDLTNKFRNNFKYHFILLIIVAHSRNVMIQLYSISCCAEAHIC